MKLSRRDFNKLGTSLLVGAAIGIWSKNLDLVDRVLDLTSITDLEKKLESQYGINIIGNYGDLDLVELNAVLRVASANWDQFYNQIEQVKYININATLTPKRVGMANHITDTIILNEYIPQAFIHELSHIHHGNLQKKSEFNEKWKNLNYDEYFTRLKNVELDLISKYNVTGSYSRYNINEDIAQFTQNTYMVKEFYNLGYELKDFKKFPYISFNLQKQVLPLSALESKLNLLLEYEFISQAERTLVQPFIEQQPI